MDNGHHITSICGHLDTIDPAIHVGSQITAGTVLGTRGSTDWSTGPHLHFQINIFGIPVNSRTFLQGDPSDKFWNTFIKIALDWESDLKMIYEWDNTILSETR